MWATACGGTVGNGGSGSGTGGRFDGGRGADMGERYQRGETVTTDQDDPTTMDEAHRLGWAAGDAAGRRISPNPEVGRWADFDARLRVRAGQREMIRRGVPPGVARMWSTAYYAAFDRHAAAWVREQRASLC